MKIDQKIIDELKRYNSINKYIKEQAEPPAEEPLDIPPPPGDAGGLDALGGGLGDLGGLGGPTPPPPGRS